MSVQERELLEIRRSISDFYFKTAHVQLPLNGLGEKEITIEDQEPDPEKLVQFSPSDLEIMEEVRQIPNFDPANPDLNILRPSIGQVKGALKGFEGHMLDYIVLYLAGHHKKVSLQKCTPIVRTPQRLLEKSGMLSDKEKALFDNILKEVRGNYRLYKLTDIPQMVSDIRGMWRQKLQFVRKKGNKREIHEGWAWGADDMYDLWNSDEQIEFGKRVLQAHELKFAKGELPLELMWGSSLQNEVGLTVKVDFPFCRANFMLSADYVIKSPAGAVVIVDNKFSPWEEIL